MQYRIQKIFVWQAEAEKPEQSRQKKYCLAMKTLNLEQMEIVYAGRFSFHMPRGAALALYGFAFVGLCAATGGFAICAVAGFAGATWDALAACVDELQ